MYGAAAALLAALACHNSQSTTLMSSSCQHRGMGKPTRGNVGLAVEGSGQVKQGKGREGQGRAGQQASKHITTLLLRGGARGTGPLAGEADVICVWNLAAPLSFVF